MRTMRAAGYVLLAVVVLSLAIFFRPVGADEVVPQDDVHARCESAIQEEMEAAARLMSQGVSGVAIAQWIGVYSAVNGVPEHYRDALIDLVIAMELGEGVSEAHDKAVVACVLRISPKVSM
jgi:hypothetical protein